MELLLATVINFGIAFIVTESHIFEWLRNLVKPINKLSQLLNCPLCFGFWSGIFLSLTFYNPTYELFEVNLYFSYFLSACWFSATSYILFAPFFLLEVLGGYWLKKLNQKEERNVL